MKLVPYFKKSQSPSSLWPDAAQLFDNFFNTSLIASPLSDQRESWMPAVDIFEKNGELVLRAELPGMEEKEIDVQLEGNVMTLKGERKLEKEEKESDYHRIESFYGTFSRSFTLPESVDRDKIKADYKNGVLTITMPQKPEVKPREIPVSVH